MKIQNYILHICFILFFIFLTGSSFSQVHIRLILKQPPPNKLNQTDLWNFNVTTSAESDSFVVVPRRFNIQAELKERASGIQARSEIRNVTLSGSNSFSFLQFNSVGITYSNPKLKEAFSKNMNAPDGNYTMCVYVKNERGKELARTCLEQTIKTAKEEPVSIQLISPANEAGLDSKQQLIFTWMPPSVRQGIEITYKLKMVEIRNNQSAVEAIKRNPAVFEKDGIRTTTLNYPLSAKKLESGKRYAWQITTFNGKANLGDSEVWSFSIIKDEPSKTQITLISPSKELPPTNTRPTFEWKTEPPIRHGGGTYSIIVREFEEGKNIESGYIIFERSGIRKNSFPYPSDILSLDSLKKYVWWVNEINEKKESITKSLPSIFAFATPPLLPLSSCALTLWLTNNVICVGDWIDIYAHLQNFNGGTWTFSGGAMTATTGTVSDDYEEIDFPLPTSETSVPGKKTYTFEVTLGSCTKQETFTVYVYPKFTGATISVNQVPVTEVCYGENNAVLTLNGLNPPNAQVVWTYQDNPPDLPVDWHTITPWGQGITINTNGIEPDACMTAGSQQVIRTYRATVDLAQWNLPSPAPLSCPNFTTVDVIVDCPTQAGDIQFTPTSGHTMVNYKICSENDYNIVLNVNLDGTTVGTEVWQVTDNNNSTTSFVPPGPYTITSGMGHGAYTFSVTVTNGSCNPITRTRTITVVDPPPMPEIEVIKIEDIAIVPPGSCPFEVCPHDDAVLRVKDFGSMPPGTKYKWYYKENEPNCPTSIPPAGPWKFAGEGYEQNTNEIGPITQNWSNMWWIVTAQDENSVCSPVASVCCEIKVKQPPCAPAISIAGPNPKCPDDFVTLNATIPSCGTIVSYQWYLNGEPYSTAPPPISVNKPGNYYLVLNGECESVQSKNKVKVENYVTKVTIDGQCCSEGKPITLTASGSNPACPSGSGTYQWTWQGGSGNGSSITVNPSQTTTYTVTYTDCKGCKATTSFTITVCH